MNDEISNWEYISYELWGNDEDGYEVNAAYTTGMVFEIEDDSDIGVIRTLREQGFIGDDVDEMDIDIDGDENTIYVNYNSWPAFELRRTDKHATVGGVQ